MEKRLTCHVIPFLNNCVASFGETYKKLQLFIIVNSKNKWTFINNSDLREVSQVPLTRLSPLIRGARGVGDLGGWLCIGSVSLTPTCAKFPKSP